MRYPMIFISKPKKEFPANVYLFKVNNKSIKAPEKDVKNVQN